MNRRALLTLPLPLPLLLGAGRLRAAPAASAAARPVLCTSDDVPPPTRLVERFINADCADCWREASGTPGTDPNGTLSLDWIAPGPLESQGALFQAARVDALARLKVLGIALPATSTTRVDRIVASTGLDAPRLRVAHGLPVGDYIGTSIELRGARAGSYRAWLMLVEELPAGLAGSPIARRLVRNSLQLDWTMPAAQAALDRLSELRPMQIAPGARAERLAVVGLLESIDPARPEAPPLLAALAQSRCEEKR